MDIALITGEPGLEVLNPMRADESRLRRSVLGPLLRVVRGNQDRGVPYVRFFETAPVYLRGEAGGLLHFSGTAATTVQTPRPNVTFLTAERDEEGRRCERLRHAVGHERVVREFLERVRN